MPEKQYYDIDGKPIQVAKKQYYDYEGKPINISPTVEEFARPKSYMGATDTTANTEARFEGPPSLVEKASSFVRGAVSKAVPIVAGLLSSNPLASGGFAAAVNLITQSAENPNLPVNPIKAIASGLVQGTLPALLGGPIANKLAGRGFRQQIFDRIIQSRHPRDIAATAALKANPELAFSASQFKPTSSVLRLLESAAPVKKGNLLQAGQEKAQAEAFNVVKDTLGLPIITKATPQALAGTQREALERGLSSTVSLANKQYGAVRLIAEANKVGFGNKSVTGPVDLQNTANLLVSELKKRGFLSGKGTVDLAKVVTDQDKQIVATYGQLESLIRKDKRGNFLRDVNGNLKLRPASFEQAQGLKEATGKLSGYDEVLRSRQEGGFTKLNKSVDTDIKNSISTWVNDPQEALKAFERGNKITKFKYEKFGEGSTKALLGATDTGTEAFQATLKDPAAIGRMIGAGRDRKPLQSEAFNQLYSKAFDPVSGKIEGKAALDMLHDRTLQESFKKIYNANQRRDIENFFVTVKNLSQDPPKLASGPALYATKSALYLSGAVLGGKIMAGGLSSYEITALGVTSLGVAANQFANKVLLNPQLARNATSLMKLSPASNQAKLITRGILGALNGEIVDATFSDGRTEKVQIKDGKIHLNKNNN